MIKPTVGRVLWYWPESDMDQPHAAIVAHVWSDTCVNLTCWNANGEQYAKTSVLLNQEESNPIPDQDYCSWMPYQIGQAKKHENDSRDEKDIPKVLPEPLLENFKYAHLPERLKKISAPFCCLAKDMVASVPAGEERTVMLRKLMESKDCAVRASL